MNNTTYDEIIPKYIKEILDVERESLKRIEKPDEKTMIDKLIKIYEEMTKDAD